MKNAFKIPEAKQEIPDTPEARIKEIKALPAKQKQNFIPPVGGIFRLGPFIYKVSLTLPNQLRFTATLMDVIIEGVNDGSENISQIVDPVTGKGIVKE